MLDLNIPQCQVNLNDYDFQRDISVRLALSQLNDLDKKILEEILNGPVKNSFKQIVKDFSIDSSDLLSLLRKLEPLGLYQMQGDYILINKEARKRFSGDLEKFDSTFEPNLLHLQTLLNKVPIHHLPQWYSLPKASNHIFSSIIEKYFLTPKFYKKHLEELSQTRKTLSQLYQAILETESYRLSADDIMKAFHIDHTEFEKLALEFEYAFCGCLYYQWIDGKWKEFLTIFDEWRNYLLSTSKREYTTIPKNEAAALNVDEWLYLNELIRFLDWTYDHSSISEAQTRFAFFPDILETAQDLNLIQIEPNTTIVPLKSQVQAWLAQTKQEQQLSIYQLILKYARLSSEKIFHCTERELREIEKVLYPFFYKGWISIDEFIQSFTGAIRNHPPLQLTQKGKKWSYKFPIFTPEDQAFISFLIEGPLWKAGIIAKSFYQNRLYFSITPFGRMTLGD